MKNLLYSCLVILLSYACQSDSSPDTSNGSLTQKETQEKKPAAATIDRFEAEIIAMETADANREAQEDEILFVGSSSIRLWESLEEDMDPMPVINRGFGGSTLPELIHYAERIIFSYSPKLIVIYCGENDIADGASPEETFASYQQLVQQIKTRLPNSNILYLSMKPSLSRWELWDKYKKGNELIRQFSEDKAEPRLHYKDIGALMLNSKGEPEPSIFIEDGLHMNTSGYARWTVSIKPRVFKLFKQPVEQ